MKKVLIVGCGDIARRCLPWLARRFRLRAVVRAEHADRAALAALQAAGGLALAADLDQPASLRRLAGVADAVIYLAPPASSGEGDPRLQRFLAVLASGRTLPQRLVYVGTTGVYGDCAGARVSETRPLAARTPRACRRQAAEALLRDFGRRSGVVVTVLRAPGIYAGDRLPRERLRRGDPVLNAADDVYTNHIHADDLARLVCLALFRGRPGRAYNASDDSGLKMGEYFDLLADATGLPRPPRLARAVIAERLSPLSLSFMEESRQLDNRRLKDEFRIRLRYPTVADALAAPFQSPGENH